MLTEDKEYYSIGEVSKITQLPQYVLRYWESEFKLLRPVRRISGHRKYTEKDIKLINEIKDLLHTKKYTIAGAKKYLITRKRESAEQLHFELKESSAAVSLLKEIKKDLQDLKHILK